MRLFLFATFLLGLQAAAQELSLLAPPPDWSALEAYQETMTKDDFVRLLNEVYAPRGAAESFIHVADAGATIQTRLTPPATFLLRFASPGQEKPAPHAWRPAAALGPAPAERPLEGVKIALDPGHLGGPWARMEERWFQVGQSKPVTEGDLTLRVAELLRPILEKLGATVTSVRTTTDPVTTQRPEDFRVLARQELRRLGHHSPKENYHGYDDPGRGRTVQSQSELLFYRLSEIRARAHLVNEQLVPDLTLCLHFNAEAWGNPARPQFVPRNHLHILLNGCYDQGELRHDDVRLEMLLKLLSRIYPEERAAGEAVAASMSHATGLPAYTYTTGVAIPVGDSGYLWARNLLANRLYHNPVIFIEPYVMNSEAVWERVQAGDYDGELEFGGQSRRSIFREYAESVAEGLRDYYAKTRGVR